MLRSTAISILLTVVLLTAVGCKKKPKTVPTAQAQVPTITSPAAETVPEKIPEAVPEKTTTPPPETPKVKPKPKPRAAKKPPVRPPVTEPAKPPVETAKATPPPRIVVQPATQPPTETHPAVIPEMSHTEEAHRRQTTEQLMQSTDANLKSLNRVLTVDERSLLQQVNAFMAQAREAIGSQDLVRAHNLAMKAHLLSDELVR